ncbi:MAG: sugar transferase [Nitrospirae bacterium]|nr:sugar transferase [Nitrospirota bacterium]
MPKRIFDIIFCAAGLAILSPLFIVIAALVKATSPGPVFYRQERSGRDFKPFKIFKFRSMAADADITGAGITSREDRRITKFGAFLRRTKLDELPQLINVLAGDMSLVGPRPEIPGFVDRNREAYAEILKVRPGITDIASIKFLNEAALLSDSSDEAEKKYLNEILPRKLKYGREYLERQGLIFDIRLILETIYRILVQKKLN